MKALLSKQVGGPETLVIEDAPDPVAKPGAVVVSVKACGVNYPDVLIIEDKYQFKPARPFSPGGEISGVVKAVGEGVTHLKPGDRVLGSTGNGGMAQEIALEASRLTPIPDSMPFDEAAAFLADADDSRDFLGIDDQFRLQPARPQLHQKISSS